MIPGFIRKNSRNSTQNNIIPNSEERSSHRMQPSDLQPIINAELQFPIDIYSHIKQPSRIQSQNQAQVQVNGHTQIQAQIQMKGLDQLRSDPQMQLGSIDIPIPEINHDKDAKTRVGSVGAVYKASWQYDYPSIVSSSSTTASLHTDTETYASTSSNTSTDVVRNISAHMLYRNSSPKSRQESCKLTKQAKKVLETRISKYTIETVSLHTKTIISCKKPSKTASRLMSLERFISNLIESSRVNMGTLLCTLVYLNKLKNYLPPGSQGQECTGHRIFLAALILAGKYLNDSSPKNKYWARYSSIFSVQEVNLMEKQFLDFLDFDLKVETEDLNQIAELFCAEIQPVKVPSFLQNFSLHKISFGSSRLGKFSDQINSSELSKKIRI